MSVGVNPVDRTQWDANKRRELKVLIESIIRKGITQSIFIDPNPQLTARYIPGMVRGALIDHIDSVDPEFKESPCLFPTSCPIVWPTRQPECR